MFFGVSLPVVQVGGGLVVVSMEWNILPEKDEAHQTACRSMRCSDALHSTFYPFTLPLTVGPGSISVAVTLGANSTRQFKESDFRIVEPTRSETHRQGHATALGSPKRRGAAYP
ncbi:MAG: hypothetical protein C5B58_08500 [Acidobacteria bacterium]|nr:MAG: hypothetical protein C5B58_08500 [Acidobacteriota bacterium]